MVQIPQSKGWRGAAGRAHPLGGAAEAERRQERDGGPAVPQAAGEDAAVVPGEPAPRSPRHRRFICWRGAERLPAGRSGEGVSGSVIPGDRALVLDGGRGAPRCGPAFPPAEEQT